MVDSKPDSVTISWRKPNYFEIDFYRVEIWGPSNNTLRVTNVSGEKTRETIRDLESAQTYNVTMYSANKYGLGQMKSILRVETRRKGKPRPCPH